MKLVVLGNDVSFNELSPGAAFIKWVRIKDIASFKEHKDADAFFNLNNNAYKFNYANLSAPVFINSVAHIIGESKNIIRINGWKGFLANETWEVAGDLNDKALKVLKQINKKIIVSKDVPGFISAGIIAMIINEAFFAKQENISTEKEIDIAMKLGTNYPFGPFEWSEKIGLKNIYNLLLELAFQNKKYSPSPLMVSIINNV